MHWKFTETNQRTTGASGPVMMSTIGNVGLGTVFIFFLLASFSVDQLHAQSDRGFTLKGKIVDTLTKEGIAFAMINITNSQQKSVSNLFSEEDGSFRVVLPTTDRYRVSCSNTGYKPFETFLTISPGNVEWDAGLLELLPDHNLLDGATIVSRRYLIRIQEDKLIYDAEHDPSSLGGSAADVLRKAPLLSVDPEGKVAMRGNTNLKILINGKATGQIARNPADALNMMPADIIKSVEIISSPSAKYDAEGASGVINIITKKGSQSIGGAIEAVLGNMEQTLNPRLCINRERWSLNANMHLHRLRVKKEEQRFRTSYENDKEVAKLWQQIRNVNIMPHGSADINVDYEADNRNTFSFSVSSWWGNWPDDSRMQNVLRPDDNAEDVLYQQYSKTQAPYAGADVSAGFIHQFNRPEQKLSLLLQGTRGQDVFNYTTTQNEQGGIELSKEKNDNTTRYGGWTAQADYSHPFGTPGKWMLEAGAKADIRHAASQYEVHKAHAGQWQYDAMRSDEFGYRQQVWATYMLLKYNAGRNWNIQAGLRLEETFLNGVRKGNGDQFNQQFSNLVPSVTLSQKKEGHVWRLSYNQRISRPYVWDMNTNIDARDPQNIKSGNPLLVPEIVHQGEGGFSQNSSRGDFLSVMLYGRYTNNGIQEWVTMDASGITYRSKQNLTASSQYGINIGASYQLFSQLGCGGNVDFFHATYKSTKLNIDQNGLACQLNFNLHYKLPANYMLQTSAEYNSRIVTLQGQEARFYYYTFSAKKDFSASGIVLALNLVNPFAAYVSQDIQTRTSEFGSSNRVMYYNRAVKLVLQWRFGKYTKPFDESREKSQRS